MVVLTIVTRKNGNTVYFEEPIPQVHYMRLVSCRLCNSWHNLKAVGVMFYKKREYPKIPYNKEMTQVNIAEIPQGHYNLLSLVRELKSSIAEKKRAELIYNLKQIHLIQRLKFSTQFTRVIKSMLHTIWLDYWHRIRR